MQKSKAAFKRKTLFSSILYGNYVWYNGLICRRYVWSIVFILLLVSFFFCFVKKKKECRTLFLKLHFERLKIQVSLQSIIDNILVTNRRFRDRVSKGEWGTKLEGTVQLWNSLIKLKQNTVYSSSFFYIRAPKFGKGTGREEQCPLLNVCWCWFGALRFISFETQIWREIV